MSNGKFRKMLGLQARPAHHTSSNTFSMPSLALSMNVHSHILSLGQVDFYRPNDKSCSGFFVPSTMYSRESPAPVVRKEAAGINRRTPTNRLPRVNRLDDFFEQRAKNTYSNGAKYDAGYQPSLIHAAADTSLK